MSDSNIATCKKHLLSLSIFHPIMTCPGEISRYHELVQTEKNSMLWRMTLIAGRALMVGVGADAPMLIHFHALYKWLLFWKGKCCKSVIEDKIL